MDDEALDPPERRPKSRYQQWCDGELSTWDLDAEEVDRGYPRDRSGKFNGKGPQTIPRARYAELYQRRQERDVRAIRDLTPVAVKTLLDVMGSEEEATSDRLRAVALVLERSVPRVTESVDVQVSAAKPWESLLVSGIFRELPGVGQDEGVQEAEVVE